MIINPFIEEVKDYEMSPDLIDFVKESGAQWYVLTGQSLGEVYVKHGAILLPNKYVEQFIREEIYEKYDDGFSFVRDEDCERKVVVLLSSLAIYEEVFEELNLFDLNIMNKEDAINFIQKFNEWVLAKNNKVEIFEEWYHAIEETGYYLTYDETLNDKCLQQLCNHYLSINNYTPHGPKNIPVRFLNVDVDEHGVFYSNKRLLSVNREVFNSKTYIVHDGIETIDDDAFHCCEQLEHIVLPDSLRIIGMNAFTKCSNLKELILPENVCYIGECLCEHCSSLERVVLSDKIRDIKIASFYCCDALEEVKLPMKLRTLSDNVFAWTPKLRTLDLPETVFWIGGECFWHVVIDKLRIAKHAHIAEDAFLESKTEIEYI